MPERAGDLAAQIVLITAHGDHGMLEDGDLVRQHEVIPCSALGAWYTLIETKQALVTAQPELTTLVGSGLVGVDDRHVTQIGHILLRQGVYGLLDHSRKYFVCYVRHRPRIVPDIPSRWVAKCYDEGMPKNENKTHKTSDNASSFFATLDDTKRADALAINGMMEEVTGEKAAVWGTMIGYGDYHYKYASGREGDTFKIGFAPRKDNLTLYVLTNFEGQDELLSRLGKHTTGKVCLYLKRLADVDQDVLREIIKRSWTQEINSISYG
jgi:hypothetical protein